MITRNFEITLRIPEANHIPNCFQVTQNDKDVYNLKVHILDGLNEIDYSEVSSATITFSKADSTVVQGDMTVGEDSLTYTMGTNEIAYPGQVLVSIQLFGNDDERLTTSQFSFRVVRDLITPSAVKSESRFPILQQLVAEVNQLKQDIVELQVPDNSLTEAKMASDMKKNISGGVAGYDELLVLADNLETLESAFSSHLADNASETKKGHVEFATVEETLTGTDTTRAVNPAGVKALLSTASARNKNILQNWDFRKPVNQRGLTSYSNVMYTIDRWLWTVAVPTRSVTIQSGYVTITNNAGTTGIFGQKLEALEPGTYTLSVLFTDGTVENKTLTWDGLTLTEQSTSFGTLSLRLVDGFPTFAMGIGASKTINVKAVKLEKSQASTLVNDPVADYGEQLLLCKRYYRLWSTEEARTGALKEAGLMRLVSPTVGTIDIGGSTYYFASAEL